MQLQEQLQNAAHRTGKADALKEDHFQQQHSHIDEEGETEERPEVPGPIPVRARAAGRLGRRDGQALRLVPKQAPRVALQ